MANTSSSTKSDIRVDAESKQNLSEAGHYVVTAHRPGVVLLAKRCSFLGSETTDVAIVKSNRLEIRQLTSNDSLAAISATPESATSGVNSTKSTNLSLLLDLPIRGRICTLLPFRHDSIPTDLLFFTTDNHKYAVISYSPASPSQTVTHACGSLYDGILRENECGPIAVLDPNNKCIALHLYDGFVQILPIQEGYIYPSASSSSRSSTSHTKRKGRTTASSLLGKPFNARIDERTVLNMCFLKPPLIEEEKDYDRNDMERKLPARHSVKNKKSSYMPQLVILHQDSRGNQHLVSHYIEMKRNEIILHSSPSTGTKKTSPSLISLQSFMRKSRIDGGSGKLIPVGNNGNKWGGIIVLGQRQIMFHSSALACTKTIPVEHTLFLSYCCISEGRYLLGDDRGMLYLLVLEMTTEGILIAFHIEGLGLISIPSSLVYLENETVFVGSQFGDSQLIVSLMPELVIVEEYINLGPIVDFDLVPTAAADSLHATVGDGNQHGNSTRQQSQKQSLIVTCSGTGKDGSIRLIRNGIGVEEQASVDLPGIKGMWNLRARFRDAFDTYLVQSYLGETRILGFGGSNDGEEEGELEEVVFPGLDADVSTLYCGNVEAGIVQVTERGVRVLDTESYNVQHVWKPQDGIITVAGGNEIGQIVVAMRGGVLISLKVDGNGIMEIGRRQMDQEISCIDLNPLQHQQKNTNSMDIDDDFTLSTVVAVGLWNDVTVRLLSLQLEEVLKINLGGETQARSLIMAVLGNEPLLLVGLGDGNLITYCVSLAVEDGTPKISTHSRKKISLGTQTISLTAFQNRTTSKLSNTCVFATGDRPTIIYTSGTANSSSSQYTGDKLCFSNVNLSTSERMILNHVTPFQLPRSSQSECCLCLADESSLCIGIIDDIQKLHVQTLKMNGGAPRKIAHHAHGRCFAVGCNAHADGLTNFLRFLDNSTLTEFFRVDLDPYEMILSLLSTPLLNTSKFTDPPKHYIVVGTAYGYPDEDEPIRGRILVYEILVPKDPDVNGLEQNLSSVTRTVKQVTEHTTRGGVYSLAPFSDGALIGTVNNKTNLYRFRDIDGIAELKVEPGATHHGHILSLCIKSLPSAPHLAIVGDLMRSISVLEYLECSQQQHVLEEVSRDYNANWMTALEMLSEEIYLGSENFNNIFVLKRNTQGSSDEVRCRLDTIGEFHLGEMVNKFMRGSLIMPTEGQSSVSSKGSIISHKGAIKTGSETLYATVDGSIGSVIGLDASSFAFFTVLERYIALEIPGVGDLSHEEYRSFEAERRIHPSHGIIDGDLVESFLDLHRSDMEKVVQAINSDGGWESMANYGKMEGSAFNTLSPGQGKRSWDGMLDEGKNLTVEEVVTRVEEISRMH